MKVTLFVVFLAVSLFVQNRQIAVTIDVLPVVSSRKDLKNRQQITKKLLSHIPKTKASAVGFVNKNKLYDGDKRDEAQVKLLPM